MIGVQTCPSEENKNVGVELTHDRSGQPGKRSDAVYHELKMLNTDNELILEIIEEYIDFKNPGLPHSTVKQLQSANVRELIQKNREPSKSTSSSTRPTTESIIFTLQ